MIGRLNVTLKGVSILAATLMVACQTTAATEPVPAVLASIDSASMDKLKATLSAALNQKSIEFGATDWASSTISVLPVRGQSPNGAPFHQQDFAIPKQFDLIMDASACYLMGRHDHVKIPLENIACRAL
ncbi:MAG: hypothetical protein ABJ275_07765 [Maricaulaceae bacterium]